MPVVDTLVTKYVLNAEDYKKGAADIQASTGRLISGFEAGFSAVKGLGVGLAGIAGSVIGLGGMAVKAASDWEVLNSQLAVVTGSFERAKQIAEFADRLALPSAFFDTKQLASAAKLLETMQLQTERFLPLVSTMASLDYNPSTESLMGFAAALGRLKAGSFGEAFERMREFGISAQDLMAEGLSFKNGQFQLFDGESTAQAADRALAAVEAIVKKRFGKMDEIMGGTMSAKFATFGETVSKAFRIVGTAINERLKVPFGEFVDKLLNFVNSPMFETLAQKFASLVDFDKMKDTAISFFAGVMAAFNQLPNIITSIQGLLKRMWDVATQTAIAYASVQAGIMGAQIVQGIMGVAAAFAAAASAAGAAAATSAAFQATLGNIGALVIGVTTAGIAFAAMQRMIAEATKGMNGDGFPGWSTEQWKADKNKIEQEMRAGLGEPIPTGDPMEQLINNALNAVKRRKGEKDKVEAGAETTELETQTGYLAAIERNTRPEGQTILGGGNLAAMGVTPVELGGINRGRNRLEQAVKLIAQYVSEEQARSMASTFRTANPFIGSR